MRLSRFLAVLALATSLYLMVTDDQRPPPNPYDPNQAVVFQEEQP